MADGTILKYLCKKRKSSTNDTKESGHSNTSQSNHDAAVGMDIDVDATDNEDEDRILEGNCENFQPSVNTDTDDSSNVGKENSDHDSSDILEPKPKKPKSAYNYKHYFNNN